MFVYAATLGQSGNQLSPLYGTEETVKYLQVLLGVCESEQNGFD